jgi:small-conductance mechanosensitive channel
MEEEQIERDSARLARMEEAAQSSSNPEEIKEGKPKREPVSRSDKVWVATCLGGVVFLIALWFVLGAILADKTLTQVRNYMRGGMLIIVVLLATRLIEVFVIGRVGNPVHRFNLKRILRLLAGLAICFVAISVLFVNWYTAVVSLGLVSLILGFALQTPISSFIGWIYILVRAPFRVGDRIKVSDFRGDVIDVGYLDTTLWEIGGDYLTGDHPSGRIIRIPNTTFLNVSVVNYSWPLFPYIWNEIRFQIAYESDLQFVAETMHRIAEQELAASMKQKVKTYRDILASTPVNALEVHDTPVVTFRVSDNTWVEAVVRYLVQPREAGRVKAKLLEQMLIALNTAPDKALFPKSNNR